MRKSKIDIRHKRMSLIVKLENFESNHCNGCERPGEVEKESTYACKGCPVFAQIRAVGDELNNLSNQRRLNSAPKELTRTSYLQLRECGWTQEEICKRYEIGHNSFHFFLLSNELGRHTDDDKKRNKITMSTAEYHEMRESGMLDKEIAKAIGVTQGSINKWKKRKSIGSYAEVCSK